MSTIQEGDPTAKVHDELKEQNVDNKKKEKGEVESFDEDCDYNIELVKVTKNGSTKMWQNQPELHRLKYTSPLLRALT
jgi:hypothetical protein